MVQLAKSSFGHDKRMTQLQIGGVSPRSFETKIETAPP
jgi:hypothetical protein